MYRGTFRAVEVEELVWDSAVVVMYLGLGFEFGQPPAVPSASEPLIGVRAQFKSTNRFQRHSHFRQFSERYKHCTCIEL